MINKRTAGLFLAALLVLVVAILTLLLGQALAARLSPTAVPTRTPRPTWTRQLAGFVMATPTPDTTRFPDARPPAAQVGPGTPQLIVPGEKQPLIVPQGGGQGGVVTVVVVIVTATPIATETGTPGPPGAFPGSGGAASARTPAAAAPSTRPPPVPSPSNTPPPPVLVHVALDRASVRQGPGTNYTLVTQVDKGTTITVVGRNRAGDWWKVCCVNGSDVWIADAVVTVEGPLWLVPEVTTIPASPMPTYTPAPAPTITPTPTDTWAFHLRSQQTYPHGSNFLQIGAIIANSGSVPLYGYKLRIRKLSTGQEWLSNGSDAFFTTETTQWNSWPTPNAGVPRNLKWDSNQVGAPMGDGGWDITVTDGGGTPVSTPVNIWTSSSKPLWYYLVFNGQ